MKNFDNYLKNKKIMKDMLSIDKAHMFCNLFKNNIDSNSFFKKKLLPFGWHWLYFTENLSLESIGVDGHPKRGDFFPALNGCKRMFAGSEIFFLNKVFLNNLASKTSQISNIENKSKDNRKIFFITVKNIFKVKNKIVLIENQKIVFVDQDYKSKKKIIEKNDGYTILSKKNFCFNNIMLFRYSSITYNSHRIHYDIDYTKKEEGYKNLLVHGPLLASYALEQLSLIKNIDLDFFEFKMLKSVIVNEEITLKVLKDIVHPKKFKVTIVNKHSNELKFIATCNNK